MPDPALRSETAPRKPLRGRAFRSPGHGTASAYCAELLRVLGADADRADACGTAAQLDTHPDLAWAASGAMALTGEPGGIPRLAPGPLACCASGASMALAALRHGRWPGGLDGAALLGERAALLGLGRRGAVSPGGSCRLLRARDGWIAVNLARADDLRSLAAWLGAGEIRDPWSFAAERLAALPVAAAVERARLLELPVAALAARTAAPGTWFRVAARGEVQPATRPGAPLVVDLSALWAGPLCAHLLSLAGARVVKVESFRRPDGARGGDPAFYDLMNAGKASVALDFTSKSGRNCLKELLDLADIVVESARPRALSQLGIDAAEWVASQPGRSWVSITGYGRTEPEAGWVAFGDDAAVAAGLAAVPEGAADAGPLFCADAVADPLTGLHAALAALAFHLGGGGALLDVSLRAVVAHATAFRADGLPQCGTAQVRRLGPVGAEAFEVVAGSERRAVEAPRARARYGAARALGADTGRVLRSLGIAC